MRAAWLSLALLLLASACDRQPPADGDAGAATSAASALSSEEGGPRPQAPRWGTLESAAATLPCRAVAAEGDVRAEGIAGPGLAHRSAHGGADAAVGAQSAPVTAQSEIPQDAWLTLGAGARLVAKDPRTTRETTFLGPGRAQVCVAHREESWIASGRFESVGGAGERPGAEEWVVMPLGVVRYAAAKVQIDVSPKATALTLASGVAYLWPASDAGDAAARGTRGRAAGDAGPPSIVEGGWIRLLEGTMALGPSDPRRALRAARTAVTRCTSNAARSRELAALLLSPDAARPDASTAADQVTARRLARAACALAALRAGTLSPSPSRDALKGAIATADAAWETLP